MNNFNNTLKKYAELTVKIGVNLQKNQTLVVNSPIECKDFVRLISEIAFKEGARDVHVEWNDEELTRIKYFNAPSEAFNEFPKWKADGLEEFAKNNAAFLSISAANPELLKGVSQERIANANKARSFALKKYTKYIMNSDVSWCVVSIPTANWAKKVFPNLNEGDALEKLWETIFSVVRVEKENPVSEWKNHINKLKHVLDFLNNNKFESLHYKSKETDLTIKLPNGHIWAGGSELNSKGIEFVANMPTEEVFTVPLKDGVDGYVTSTKPLNYGGNLINNFKLNFKNGRIVDYSASEGYETLKQLIEIDDGSHYLGEVALVPNDSPISNSEIIFFNTLFDENASCHLAFGSAYPTCIENGTTMTEEELIENGVNQSLTHQDFMIGSSDLNITGITKSGEKIDIFKNGNWAF